ncbi:MAG: leucine-rich repeat domain-containing protein [Defluviitaleaceae bacterium]|nr:leucine-rich repeat domain-containing protein [Defluviitaleaceae bacterium]
MFSAAFATVPVSANVGERTPLAQIQASNFPVGSLQMVDYCHFLNVRRGASPNYAAFTALSRFTQVTVLEFLNAWVRVDTPHGEGWIYAGYLSRGGASAVAAVPVVPVVAVVEPIVETPVAEEVVAEPVVEVVETTVDIVVEPIVEVAETTVDIVTEPVAEVVETPVDIVVDPVVEVAETTVDIVAEPVTEVAETTPLGEIPDYITLEITEQVSTSATEFFTGNFFSATDDELVYLRYMTNLQTLSLVVSRVSDLTPLADLVNLQHLSLSGGSFGNIGDLTPIAGLTNLQTLYLTSLQISDLTPLAGLTNLQILRLDLNQISDLTPLAGLTNLQLLHLHSNQISDLTPLAGLTNLQGLNLNSNQIDDLTPLAGLTNLHDEWGVVTSPASPAGGGFGNLTSGLNLIGNPVTDNPAADWSPVDHLERVGGRPYDWVRQQ